jgi:type I restriction enzyme S subunit
MTSSIEAQLSQLTIDKSGWTPVKFGDVAYEPKESVKDALKEGVEHVVGLEHINAEDIHLRRSNSIEESTTFSKKFSPGDVLFGRRRAYLKKAARADFAGICSGDIIVMRAKDNLLPELLPFIVNNESFFDWAITHSAGGLSPRCKFKDLANYEFLLPPKAQQTEIAELLWAIDEVIQKEAYTSKKLRTAYIVQRERDISESNFDKKTLAEIVNKLITYGIVQPGPDVADGVPYIQSSDIKNSQISSVLSRTTNEIAKSYARSEVSPGDIIFSLRGNLGDTAIVPKGFEKINMARGVARISLKGDLDNSYVKYALETRPILGRILAVSQGSTFKEVSLDTLRKIKVPIPKRYEDQCEISQKLNDAVEAMRLLDSKISNSQSLQKSLINQVF